MKTYILFSGYLCFLGGEQAYIAGITRYLERSGWTVRVLSVPSPLKSKWEQLNPSLEKYAGDQFTELQYPPAAYLPKRQAALIKKIVIHLSEALHGSEEIIIESHDMESAGWGELLAREVHGRHVILALSERFQGRNLLYAAYQDYLLFKYQRGEIMNHSEIINKIFQGKKIAPQNYRTGILFGAEQDMVQEVDSPIVDVIERKDYNIALISRMEKEAVKGMLQGVREFALAHGDKEIQFVIVGNAERKLAELKRVISPLSNITLTLLGVQIPVPKSLFRKMDVILAISQTAIFASYEGVPCIVPFYEKGNGNDGEYIYDRSSAGVLGYDTNDACFGKGTITKRYVDVLEDVLVQRSYDGQEFQMPPRKPAEFWYALTTDMIQGLTSPLEYDISEISRFRWDKFVTVGVRQSLLEAFPFLIPIRRKLFEKL